MLETSSDDLFMPTYQEEMVDKLLSGETPDEDFGLGLCGVLSLAEARLPSLVEPSSPPYQEEMVDKLSGETPEEDFGLGLWGGLSLAEALLPLVEPSSPSPMPWVCSTRYKTELCTNYASTGFCMYAKRCQFAHGLHELHVPSRHPKYKTALCHSYHSVGKCAYGTRCLFVHSPMEQRPSSRRHHKNIPCRNLKFFGVCPYGTGCNFLHIEDRGEGCSLEAPDSDGDEKFKSTPGPLAKGWKPRGALCRTFSALGFCVYGTRCLFQHGLPGKMNGTDVSQSPGDFPSPSGSRAVSPSNVMLASSPFSATSSTSSTPCSTTSSTPPSTTTSPLNTPTVEPTAHNAFTFSSQHLNDLLLPLALKLQQLDGNQVMAVSTRNIWDNRSL